MNTTTQRRIVHIDMDAFFASVEQRDDPRLRGRPVAVGGEGRGVVAAASYEAREYGVRSAMPMSQARKLCKSLIVVPPRFEAYREASQQMRAIFADFASAIEPLSLDEAFLDVSLFCHQAGCTGRDVAILIQNRIAAETQLSASAGVSYCRFIAKLASDYRKPRGVRVVAPAQAQAFLAQLPVERFFGVGPSTAQRLHAAGWCNGAHLQAVSVEDLIDVVGSFGQRLWELARGIDERPVQARSTVKSIGQERTFAQDLTRWESIVAVLNRLSAAAMHEARQRELVVGNVGVKWRDTRFVTHSRQQHLSSAMGHRDSDLADVQHLVQGLLREMWQGEPLRLLGVRLTSLEARSAQKQGELWEQ